jgi:hypothetical protein
MAARDVDLLRSKWGGRHDYDNTGKVDVVRVRLDRQGYADNGQYFGVGAPVWNVNNYDGTGGEIDFYIRAYDKAAAKAKVIDAYPGVGQARRRRR